MPIATANGIDVSYRVEGEGEPLVLIMGFSAEGDSWAFQRKVDNRGVGKSSKPAGAYTIMGMADDAVGLMDHLGIHKAHILGVSMGGLIAQEIAINHPERVMKLILAATYACRDNMLSGPTAEMERGSGLSMKSSMGRLVGMASGSAFTGFLLGLLMRVRLTFAARSAVAGLLGQQAACRSHDTLSLSRLRLIQSPTLVMAGTRDRVIKPSSSEVLAREIPNARLVKFEGGSHMFSMEMHKRFNAEVLEFLKNG